MRRHTRAWCVFEDLPSLIPGALFMIDITLARNARRADILIRN